MRFRYPFRVPSANSMLRKAIRSRKPRKYQRKRGLRYDVKEWEKHKYGPESPFEAEVGNFIRKLGFQCHYQVSAPPYRIDIAIIHNGEYVLAIECDGWSFHSSDEAKRNDHSRQKKLEEQGWTFHRICSQDWFRDKKAEKATLEFILGEITAPRNLSARSKIHHNQAPQHVPIAKAPEPSKPNHANALFWIIAIAFIFIIALMAGTPQ